MVFKQLNKFETILAVITSVVIILFYLFFNFNYLTDWIDEKGDSKTYDYYVRLGIPKFLFNPHHIGFDWLGERFYKALQNNGYTGASMVVLQLRNLIVSSIFLGILFFLFYKFSRKYLLSLLLVLMIAFSCAYWIYSQINDTPIIHSVLVALLFFATIYFPSAKFKMFYAIFLGIFHAIIIFFHQSDAIFGLVIVFVIMFSNFFLIHKENSKGLSNSFDISGQNTHMVHSDSILYRLNIKYLVVYGLSFVLVVVVAYYYVGIILIGLTLDPDKAEAFNSFEKSTYFFNWLILYTKIDYWGKGYEGNTLQKVIHGITTYFYQAGSLDGKTLVLNLKQFFSPISILPNMLFIFITSVLFSGVFLCRSLYKRYRYIILSNVLFFVVYIIFACWWEPDYREFWVAPMFSFWIAAFFILNHILDKVKIMKPVSYSIIYSYLFLCVFLLFYFNFTGFIYPNSSTRFQQFDIVKSETDRVK